MPDLAITYPHNKCERLSECKTPELIKTICLSFARLCSQPRMFSEKHVNNNSRKRKRTIEAESDLPFKRQRQARSWTPEAFWDNLSRIPLCRRALREFNRRVPESTAPKPPPFQPILEQNLIKQLKRFVRQGGPNLSNIRGVSHVYGLEFKFILS
jgi:hypothetical protein